MKYLTCFFLFAFQAMAAETLWCTHPKVCHFAQLFTRPNLEVKPLFKLADDPHHDHLTSKRLKKMIHVDYLLFAPPGLQKFPARVYQARKNKKTWVASLPPTFTPAPEANHFWLSPLSYCHVFDDLKNTLTAWGLTKEKLPSCQFSSILDELRSAKELQGAFFIFGHNALKNLADDLNWNYTYLLNSNDHHVINPKALKAIEDLKTDYVIWVEEPHLKSFSKLKKKYFRPGHKTFLWDPVGRNSTDPLGPLKSLTTKLKNL